MTPCAGDIEQDDRRLIVSQGDDGVWLQLVTLQKSIPWYRLGRFAGGKMMVNIRCAPCWHNKT
jgi:hypothetical protein